MTELDLVTEIQFYHITSVHSISMSYKSFILINTFYTTIMMLLYKQFYGNMAILSLLSITKLYQADQFVAGFFTDLLYLLQNINVIRFSNSVRWKNPLFSILWNTLSLYTVAMRWDIFLGIYDPFWPQQPGCRRQREMVKKCRGRCRVRGQLCSLYPKRATSWHRAEWGRVCNLPEQSDGGCVTFQSRVREGV